MLRRFCVQHDNIILLSMTVLGQSSFQDDTWAFLSNNLNQILISFISRTREILFNWGSDRYHCGARRLDGFGTS